MRLASLVLVAFLLLSSCSVRATVELNPDGSAELSAVLQASSEARAAWTGLRELDSTLPPDPLSGALLRKGLGKSAKVVEGNGETTVSVPIRAVASYLPGWKAEGKVWQGSITRETLRRWVSLTGFEDSPALDSVLPSTGDAVTESEYRDLLLYLLGPQVPVATGKALLDHSVLELTLITPAAVRAAPGSVSIEGRSVTYRWPLVKMLTLTTPVLIRLEF